MNEYWESGSFLQGDIASGPPPNLAVPTINLAANNGWRISHQQEDKKKPESGRRYEAYKNCTTTIAALANGCTVANQTWD
jgi:hypothetical protein